MRNLYRLAWCGDGQTRALAAFASVLGQIGIEENQAHMMFDELANRWGARTENIFLNYFRKMKVPACQRLISDDNRGFPKGVSIKLLGVCKPDIRCGNVSSPYYYADKEGNRNRLLTPLLGKQTPEKANDKTEKQNISGSFNLVKELRDCII
jgi:hypothetical protein